jgi:hypothetical protein
MGFRATPKTKAIAAASGGSATSAMIGDYWTYSQGELYLRAMSVPAYSRAVGLISKCYWFNEISNV